MIPPTRSNSCFRLLNGPILILLALGIALALSACSSSPEAEQEPVQVVAAATGTHTPYVSPSPFPPTDTPVVPTNTPPSPTDTHIPPTDTPIPPTDTSTPPTDTPIPADTSTPATTDTPVPTARPTEPPPPLTVALALGENGGNDLQLQSLSTIYIDTAHANVRTAQGRLAVVPSPVYANGIYGRDAFYTALGLEDDQLFWQAYRWFEAGQDRETGQVPTALPLDPADVSLSPQDDETTLLFLIWSSLLHDKGYDINKERISAALAHVLTHVADGRYLSPPGNFRYWADCWRLDVSSSITYNQGLYALALRMLLDMELSDVTPEMANQALAHYQGRYDAAQGLLAQQDGDLELPRQDGSALLPEFLHRLFMGKGMLADEAILDVVDNRLALAGVRDRRGELVGLKIIANSDGTFASPDQFACPTLSIPGDYQNGGHWPLFSTIELALAYSIDTNPEYRKAIEQLVQRDLVDGSPKEYWMLSPDRLGAVNPGRNEHAWNVLIIPALRHATLIE